MFLWEVGNHQKNYSVTSQKIIIHVYTHIRGHRIVKLFQNVAGSKDLVV
jgi:hypothetical protein